MPKRSTHLDALRGLAALGVMLFHFSGAIHRHIDPTVPVLWAGAWGVQVFFVISGYVILMTAHRARDRSAFAWARFVRLAPAFYACCAVSVSLAIVLGARPQLDWLWNLTMAPLWFGAPPAETVYWTLGYEIAFYAVVWACLPWIKRGWTIWICAAMAPVLLWQPVVAYFIFGIVIYEFRAGAPNCTHRTAMLLRCGRFLGEGRDGGANIGVGDGAVWCKLKAPFAPARITSWLGAISYPLYLIHYTLGRMLLMVIAPVLGWQLSLLVSCAAMIVLATVINRWVEMPGQAALKRLRIGLVREAVA